MKKFAIKITLQAGEKEFSMTKLFSSDVTESLETVSRDFLETYFDEPELETSFCAFYNYGEYAITVRDVKELTDEQYSILKEII